MPQAEPYVAPAPAVAPAPVAPAPPQASAPAGPAALPKEVVQAKFKELVAAGVEPNEAATRAIKEVRESLAAAAAPEPAAAAPAADDEGEKLQELANMGFTDEQRNRELLRKYAGRME